VKNGISTKVLAVAPHPDDETFGCGGSLLRHKAAGDEVHWLICTEMTAGNGYSDEQRQKRDKEIESVARAYGFASVQKLGFPTTKLDTVPLSELVARMSEAFKNVQPNAVYLPYRGDVHSDHAITFDAAAACCKSFRFPSIKRVMCYETLSETEFGINPDANGFRPQVFISIAEHLDRKIEILKIYESELSAFPFPRSEECVRSLAALRGSSSGSQAAEAFLLSKEIID